MRHPADRLREQRWRLAIAALQELHERDAATICATVLDEIGEPLPRLDYWSDAEAEAEAWVSVANAAQIVTVAVATMRRLEGEVVGVTARKRLLAELWRSLSEDDRAAFLAWTRAN